jgi:predicted secreted protein
MKRRWMLLFLVLSIGFSTMANADIMTIGTASYNGQSYSLIYDTDQHLIWFNCVIQGDWYNAMNWASGLNTDHVLSYDFNKGVHVHWEGDWRLPSAGPLPPQDPTTSEMGHIYFVELGNGPPVLTNQGPFNLMGGAWFWTQDIYPANTALAYTFNTHHGGLNIWDKTTSFVFADAVRAAEVRVTEPTTMLLLGLGLVGLAGIRRKFRK